MMIKLNGYIEDFRPGFDLLRISLCLLFFTSFNVFAEKLPDSMFGVWQVQAVHTNMASSRRNLYQLDDPRLRWRLFTFSSERIVNDTPEASVCEKPQMSVGDIVIADLISGSIAGYGYPQRHSTPEDYGVDVSPEQSVKLISIAYDGLLWEGSLGAGTGQNGAWIFFRSNGTLMLRWYDEPILVLEKIARDATPQPSFKCSAKNSPTEVEICTSMTLASFDRSVAAAYKQLIAQKLQVSASINKLVMSQRRWLLKRDSCGSDGECIAKALSKRLAELTSAIQTQPSFVDT